MNMLMCLIGDTFQNTSAEHVARPIGMLDKFLRPSTHHHPFTILDICSGSLEHINLKHVVSILHDYPSITNSPEGGHIVFCYVPKLCVYV